MSEVDPSGATTHVLVVDDNPADVRLVEEAVEAGDDSLDETVRLSVYNNGQRAIEWFDEDTETRAERIDLVLLDLNLPARPGFEILRTIRGRPRLDHVPVVVVSSSANPSDITRAYEESANAYVKKPKDPDEYIQMVQAAIQFWTTTTRT